MPDAISLSPAAEARLLFNLSQNDAVFPPSIVAHVVEMTEGTLAKMRSLGTGPAFCKRGHARYYRKSDVVAWMTSGKTAA